MTATGHYHRTGPRPAIRRRVVEFGACDLVTAGDQYPLVDTDAAVTAKQRRSMARPRPGHRVGRRPGVRLWIIQLGTPALDSASRDQDLSVTEQRRSGPDRMVVQRRG